MFASCVCLLVQLIEDCLEKLVPNEMGIFIFSKSYAGVCQSTEEWFQTLYSCEGKLCRHVM